MSRISDQAFIEAARRRLLEEIRGRQAAESHHKIINNVYGHDGGHHGGLVEHMAHPDNNDYYVDITREDLPGVNPETGKPAGWKKTGHRRTEPKKKVTME